jgi:alkylresorcinol/alkylpyrone synthase
MFITGVGTAVPPQRYSQGDCWEALQGSKQFAGLNLRARAILKKVLTGNNGIATRHLALESLDQAFLLSADALHERFARHAPLLATQAAQNALHDARTRADEIDALIVSTCTGYLCPGLTSYVSEKLGLRSEVLGLDLVGQGCGAAIPNLRTGEALLAAQRCRRVLSVCVEVCSAAFFLDNDPGVLISACLFGDGAGAAVLANAPAGRRRIEWKTSGSTLWPAERDRLRFEQKDGMLRNILSPGVPELAAAYARELFEQLTARSKMKPSQVAGWVLHPGGRDVLLALRKALMLGATDLRWSEQVLREFGNVSSASLFFVLQAAFQDSAPSGPWWMCSFGAGFSCHGALLEVET